MMKKIACFLLLFVIAIQSNSQTPKQHTAWFGYQFTKKTSAKTAFNFNLKIRSSDQYEYLKTFVLRPAIDYNFNQTFTATLGYHYFNYLYKPIGNAAYHLEEQGIWEQLMVNAKIKSTILTYRFRLEQRFIEQLKTDVFTERFRMQIRAIQPLKQVDSTFNKGLYVGLQDEILLNVQNKSALNNHILDQNRIGATLGYRLNKTIDIEAIYSNFAIRNKSDYSHTEVLQLSVNSRFR